MGRKHRRRRAAGGAKKQEVQVLDRGVGEVEELMGRLSVVQAKRDETLRQATLAWESDPFFHNDLKRMSMAERFEKECRFCGAATSWECRNRCDLSDEEVEETAEKEIKPPNCQTPINNHIINNYSSNCTGNSYSASKPLGAEEKKAELKAPARVLVFTRVEDKPKGYFNCD